MLRVAKLDVAVARDLPRLNVDRLARSKLDPRVSLGLALELHNTYVVALAKHVPRLLTEILKKWRPHG